MTLNLANKITSLQKKASAVLKKMLDSGIKNLPLLLKNLDALKQTHLEFDLGQWFIVLEKQV